MDPWPVSGSGWHRSSIVTRWEALAEDVAQARALEELEARRNRIRAAERFAAWLRGELTWFQRTNTRYHLRTTDDTDERDDA
jgi:hypothetical protein